VIVDSASWRPNGPGIPRSALTPLARELRRGWSGIEAIDARLADAGTADQRATRHAEIGGDIWPVAVPALVSAVVPDDWTSLTGLARADHATVVRSAAMALAHGALIHRLAAERPDDQSAQGEALARLWASAASLATEFAAIAKAAARAASEPAVVPANIATALATLGAVLMLRLPHADRVFAAMEAGCRDGPPEALDFVLSRLRDAALSEDLGEAAEATCHAAVVLDDLESIMADRPTPWRSLCDTRHALDTQCRARFDATAERLVASAPPPEDGPHEMEYVAQALQGFANAARRVGGPTFYDQAVLATLTQLVQPNADRPAATYRARLAELLAGPRSAAA
jgi:hypothetical protein